MKSEAEQRELAKLSGGFGNASCDACHTRHLFSVAEARRPEACETCHMGQKLFVMFLEHRMRAFQGAFHANPDYANWYGWSAMQRDLVDIRAEAADMRRVAGKAAPGAGGAKKTKK